MQPMRREMRGPVTHVGHMKGGDLEGVFLVAYGNRVETYVWTGEKLQRIAFYDAPILVTSVAVIKSFLVIGDVHKGLVFLQASSGGRQLSELGRVRRLHGSHLDSNSEITVYTRHYGVIEKLRRNCKITA